LASNLLRERTLMSGDLGFEHDLDWPQDTYEAGVRQQLLEPVQIRANPAGKSMENGYRGIKTAITRL